MTAPIPESNKESRATGKRVCIDLPELALGDNVKFSFVPAKAEVKLSQNREVQNFVKRLSLTLEANEATLQSGKPVRGYPAAVMWVLEQVACKK